MATIEQTHKAGSTTTCAKCGEQVQVGGCACGDRA